MLSAICLPQFSGDGQSEIQALRLAHCPEQAGLIGPHVTLIFPTDALPERDFIGHVVSIAGSFSRSKVCFRSSLPYLEPASGLSFVFLVPDEGFGWLNRLHERLHCGPLASAWDPTRPYIPHITLGIFKTFPQARAASEIFNSRQVGFSGLASSIEVVLVESTSVRRIHSEQLHGD